MSNGYGLMDAVNDAHSALQHHADMSAMQYESYLTQQAIGDAAKSISEAYSLSSNSSSNAGYYDMGGSYHRAPPVTTRECIEGYGQIVTHHTGYFLIGLIIGLAPVILFVAAIAWCIAN